VIRATLDANVIAAGFVIRNGLPARVVDLWSAGKFDLIISQHIVKEVAIAWGKPYWRERFAQESVAAALAELSRELTPITLEIEGVEGHHEDDLIIATAVSGLADYLVTGDKELRAVGDYRGVKIRTPQEFLEEFEALA
jgi:putative PIN family toxin of toxin-antitoxin system